MSSDLSFMDRLTNNHRSYQDKKKSEPVVLEYNYEIPIKSNEPSVEVLADKITVIAETSCSYKCGKVGIPILPVVLSKTDYKISPRDERYFSHSITPIPSSHNAVASLPSYAYLYCYIEDSNGYSFEEYYTGSDGALKKLQTLWSEDFEERSNKPGQIQVQNIDESTNDSIEEDVQPFNCTKANHSTLDSKFITLLQGDTAWLMVSHAQLSKVTLKKYIDDEMLRNKRMQKFVADDLTGNKNTVNMSVNETDYIKSFSRRKQLAQDRDIASRIDVSEQSGGSDIVGGTVAATALYRSMERSIAEYGEALASEIKPMMVALPDLVGEVIAAAEKRNYLISQLSEISEDSGYLRKVANALIIKNIETSSIKTTQFEGKDVFNWGDNDYIGTILNKAFSDTDPDDLIYPHINKSDYQSYLQASQKIIDLKNQIVSARQDFIKAITSEEFKFVLENDFDIEIIHDEGTAKDFEAMIAGCTAGCGIDDSNLGIPQSILDAFETAAPKSNTAADEEFKAALLPQLSAGNAINQNWLLKALGGLDKELVEILYGFNKKDRASEATGSGIGYISEKISTATLNRITVKSERSAFKNKEALIKTLSQNLMRLSFNDPKAFRNLHQILELSIYGHSGVVVVPKKMTATADTMAAFTNYGLGMVLPKSVVDKINTKASQVKRGITNVVEAVTDTTIVRTPQVNSLQQAETYVLYYFDKARATGQGMNALNPLNDGGQSIDLDKLDAKALAAEATKWHGNINKGVTAGTSGVSAVIAFFQLKAVIASMPAIARLKYAGDVLLLTEVQLGTVSSGLALVTASMDTTAAGASVLGKTSFANRLIYRAGWIGVVGATFEVGSLAIYGYRKFNDGNLTSSALTVGSAFSIGVSAYAGLNLGLLAIASPAAALPALPLLAIMFVGMTLSYTFQRLAYKFDDKNNTLIEYWLDNSVFGNKAMKTQDYSLINPFQTKPAFNSLAEDISGFITASTLFLANNRLQTFQGNVPIEHKIDANSGIRLPPVFGSRREHLTLFESKVVIGNWDKASQLIIEVVADKAGREQSLYKATFYHSASGKPSASNIATSAIEQLRPVVTKGESDDQYIIDTQLLKFEPRSINNAKVIVTYTPDTSRNPSYPLKDVGYLDNDKY